MKITKHANPLCHVVELDDHDRKILRMALRYEDLEERFVAVHGSLGRGEIDRAKKEASLDWMDNGEVDKWIEEMAVMYESELGGMHIGDCTCHASSCAKCHAESLLGIDTLEGTSRSERIRLAR